MVTMGLFVASVYKWPLFQMDVHNVFLQGDLNEEIYMEVAQEFCTRGESKMDCLLQKSLYDLKQTPRLWNIKLCETLVGHGYVHVNLITLCFRGKEKVSLDIVVLLTYVDDLIIKGNSQKLIDGLKFVIEQNFKMKDLRELMYFLG